MILRQAALSARPCIAWLSCIWSAISALLSCPITSIGYSRLATRVTSLLLFAWQRTTAREPWEALSGNQDFMTGRSVAKPMCSRQPATLLLTLSGRGWSTTWGITPSGMPPGYSTGRSRWNHRSYKYSNPSHIPPWERSFDREASPPPQEIRDISYQVR